MAYAIVAVAVVAILVLAFILNRMSNTYVPTPVPVPVPEPPAPTPTPEPPAPTPTPNPPTPPAPAPPVISIAWINQSNSNPVDLNSKTLSDEDAAKIVEALNSQVPDFLAAWPSVAPFTNVLASNVNDLPAGAVKAYFLANSDVADALGYHDVDPQGDPYIRVFTEPVLKNGGSALRGSISISACASHEMVEEAADPQCTSQAADSKGVQWALETADPVESDSYDVTLLNGSKVTVSDFVYPSFFEVNGNAPFDKLGVLKGPFTIAPGGYAIENNQQVFGETYSEWRKPGKAFPASRTYKRTH